MATTYTGLDSAPILIPGSIISRAYWAVPTNYTPGDEYTTEADALEAGLKQQANAVEASAAQPGNNGVSFVPEQFWIDLRWNVAFPQQHGGGSTNLVARRTSYDTLEDAREHLERLRK